MEWGTDAATSEDTAATDCLLARQVRLVLISRSGLHGWMTRMDDALRRVGLYTAVTAQSLRHTQTRYGLDTLVVNLFIIICYVNMSRDPATEKVYDRNRDEIIRYGPIRPTVKEYPPSGPRNLRFQPSWYEREDMSPWLEYSVSSDAAFCFICRCFGSLGMLFPAL